MFDTHIALTIAVAIKVVLSRLQNRRARVSASENIAMFSRVNLCSLLVVIQVIPYARPGKLKLNLLTSSKNLR